MNALNELRTLNDSAKKLHCLLKICAPSLGTIIEHKIICTDKNTGRYALTEDGVRTSEDADLLSTLLFAEAKILQLIGCFFTDEVMKEPLTEEEKMELWKIATNVALAGPIIFAREAERFLSNRCTKK